MNKKRIVILGAGFAGIYTYLSLIKKIAKEDVEILIINKTNYFLFTPMLHEVATGGLGSRHVVESVRSIIYKSCADLIVAEVEKVDLEKKIVFTDRGRVEFDYLVIALGATTNFYGIPGAEENCLVLKNLAEAIDLRNTFISNFEDASSVANKEERKKMLSFAVVGGGPTGVELVAEMADLFFDTFKKYYKGHICRDDISLYLINKGPELASMFDPSLRTKSLKVLTQKGVTVLLNKDVKEVTADAIIFADGSSIEATHKIWTAGVRPNTLEFMQDVERDKGGRIVADEYLRVKNFPNVFVLGDIASVVGKDERPMQMLAQVAVRQGILAGKNIIATLSGGNLKKFVYHSRGSLMSLGQWQAIGRVLGINWSGPFAWWLWRTTYLFNFAYWPNRIKIAVDWTINIFSPRDVTKA
ncbi:MAG: NAD(P)/FAD-dependent oxidoreductase [Candidatus Paceibacterota bacterium]